MVKVLIVDNDPGVRESLAVGLSDTFLVEEADDGARAISAMENGRPDVVLLDQNMEGGNGTSVLESLMRHKERPGVVMFSATRDLSLVRRAFKLGADDCISKPFELSAMREALSKAANKRSPMARDEAKPFSMRVAEMLREGSLETEVVTDLEERRRRFARQLMDEALADTDGDLDRAAARLALSTDEFKRQLRSLNRGGQRA